MKMSLSVELLPSCFLLLAKNIYLYKMSKSLQNVVLYFYLLYCRCLRFWRGQNAQSQSSVWVRTSAHQLDCDINTAVKCCVKTVYFTIAMAERWISVCLWFLLGITSLLGSGAYLAAYPLHDVSLMHNKHLT